MPRLGRVGPGMWTHWQSEGTCLQDARGYRRMAGLTPGRAAWHSSRSHVETLHAQGDTLRRVGTPRWREPRSTDGLPWGHVAPVEGELRINKLNKQNRPPQKLATSSTGTAVQSPASGLGYRGSNGSAGAPTPPQRASIEVTIKAKAFTIEHPDAAQYLSTCTNRSQVRRLAQKNLDWLDAMKRPDKHTGCHLHTPRPTL